MTPERMAALVRRWVRVSTRGLPTADRRVAEIDADLHDHVAHERAAGTSERRIALALASRLLRGVPADLAASRPLHHPAVRVALGVALVLALPLVGMAFSDSVVWGLADFLLAGVLLTTIGVVLELAVRKAGNVPAAVGVAALGVACCLLGGSDDAPGLVLIGLVLVAGACALGVRAAQRSR